MLETLHVLVRRVQYRSAESGFTVAMGQRDDSGEELTFVGNLPELQLDELVALTGEWKTHKTYGRQFAADSAMPVVPTTPEGIESYLSKGHVKGIGPALAKLLVERFGADLFRIMDDEPQRLREVTGIGKKTLAKIRESWNAQRGVRDLMVFLASIGLGGARAFRIHQQYGNDAVALIRQNPYRLIADVRGIGFKIADEIALRLGHERTSPFRLLAGVLHVVDTAREQGHCGIPVSDALQQTAALLKVEADAVSSAILSAIGNRIVIDEEIDGRRFLFDPVLHRAETRIASRLAMLADERPDWHDVDIEEAVAVAEEESGIPLDALQRRAVDLALTSRAVVITGGPGVGKTTLVRALVAVYESRELNVALAAPTGRAAKRLGESTGRSARTIHRLLEMNPKTGRFERNGEDPLDVDVVILDEASMIDVLLLDAVLRAMPSHAALVLVGDADQLPSIGPGQVLHDILQSERVPSIRLTEIHRQAEGSRIVLNAHAINRGEMPQFGRAGEACDMFLFRAGAPETAVRHVVDLVTTKLPERFGFHPLRDVQVLAPMRNGTVGVHLLNAELQRALNPPSRHTVRVERPQGVVFCRGDKVMQIENDYEKGVFNGDVGVIAAIDAEEEIFTVDYGGELIVDYGFDDADQLTLAYATTIHKSQGSEYPAVVIALMPQHSIMLRRNLLYTAVTRGRQLVVVVGDLQSVAKAVKTGKGGERWTRLGRCLAASPSPRLRGEGGRRPDEGS